MILSMTGLGTAVAEAGAFRGSVLVRSLNHRFLDLSIKLPRGLAALEGAVKDLVQSRVRRGRMDVAVRGELTQGAATASISRPLIKSLAEVLRQVAREEGLSGELRVADLLQVPGVLDLGDESRALEDGERDAVLALVVTALGRLDEMRAAEGARLATVLNGHLDGISASTERMGTLAEASRERRRTDLAERARELRETLGLDETRLYAEIARLVDRADTCEERDRLHGHITQARDTVARGQGGGKSLDFLAQEMMREANTIGSKASAGELVREVVGLKVEIERFREQVQNVE